jgi:hypothetical protein
MRGDALGTLVIRSIYDGILRGTQNWRFEIPWNPIIDEIFSMWILILNNHNYLKHPAVYDMDQILKSKHFKQSNGFQTYLKLFMKSITNFQIGIAFIQLKYDTPNIFVFYIYSYSSSYKIQWPWVASTFFKSNYFFQ